MSLPFAAPTPNLEAARKYTLDSVAEGAFPGAQILVAARGDVLWHDAFGSAAVEPKAVPMTLDTFVDVASLTKALVTSTAAAVLESRGLISVDMPLAALLPAARDSDKGGLTVAQLLAHAAGFPLYIPYFKAIVSRFTDYHALPHAALRAEIVDKILDEPLVAKPGAVQQYSDLDFILLGEALPRAAKKPLDVFFREDIAAPLGIGAHFRPLPAENVRGAAYAATELCPWRKEVLQGLVHDDHAYLMGGVAGHAGLFATASDVYALVRAWTQAYQGADGLIKAQTARRFWTRPSQAEKDTWTLGWDTPTPGESTSGRHFSPNSVGHLGFTGASVWVDLERDYTVILLTNRIHPLRSNLGIKKFRPAFHDLVMEGLLAAAR